MWGMFTGFLWNIFLLFEECLKNDSGASGDETEQPLRNIYGNAGRTLVLKDNDKAGVRRLCRKRFLKKNGKKTVRKCLGGNVWEVLKECLENC